MEFGFYIVNKTRSSDCKYVRVLSRWTGVADIELAIHVTVMTDVPLQPFEEVRLSSEHVFLTKINY